MEMHDPMAVWYVLATAGRGTGDWPEGWDGVERVFGVERKGEMTRGMCVVDRRWVTRRRGDLFGSWGTDFGVVGRPRSL